MAPAGEFIPISMVNTVMKKITLSLVGLLVASLFPPVFAQETVPAPLGRWLTEKQDTVVLIAPCDEELCGYIDWVHPEEEQVTQSGEPLCGQKVLWGFVHSESRDDLWSRGTIYRADDDKTYRGQLRHPEDDRITVRGYIGIPALGKTYTLTRVDGNDYPSCG